VVKDSTVIGFQDAAHGKALHDHRDHHAIGCRYPRPAAHVVERPPNVISPSAITLRWSEAAGEARDEQHRRHGAQPARRHQDAGIGHRMARKVLPQIGRDQAEDAIITVLVTNISKVAVTK